MSEGQPKSDQRTGPIWRCSKKAVGNDGLICELPHWRCAACGVSLFRRNGDCSVCEGKVRIPRKSGQ